MKDTNASDPIDDVIIVGCGPTGAALANLLGQQGLSVRVLDRNVGAMAIPRAVHIDGETMRVFQSMGLAARMLSILRPGSGMQWVNAAGETLLVRAGVEGLGAHGWHNDYYFHQPQLEDLLREGMARFPRVRLQEGTELQQLRQDSTGVELQCTDADGATQTLRARYVVGCDGARSTVRQWVGGEDFEHLGEHQAWLVVDGVLHHPLDLPEHTVQHCDPARPATSIYVHPLRRRWELMLLPDDDPKTMVEPQTVWPLLQRWVKPSQAVLERAATYVFHALISRRWQNGRALLAGDAAHLTPPFLGQGLCAAMRDVANLAWKLAWALRDPLHGAAALATYGPERLPHVREFIALAVAVGKIIQVTEPSDAAQRDERLLLHNMTFAFPSPTLGPGVHSADAGHTVVGRIAPQFELPDGRWTDEVAGGRWSLLLDDAQLAADDALLMRLARANVAVIRLTDDRGARWLREQGTAAVILRPDRYVFDACTSPAGLNASTDALEQWLGVS
jgi:3-(3-hydroxy-phenyl)propionate hydroxylase